MSATVERLYSSPTHRRSTATAGGVVWIVGAVQYLAAQGLAAQAWHPAYSWTSNYISDLGNTACGPFAVPHGTAAYVCSPRHDLMNTSFVVSGVLFLVGLFLLRPAWPQRRHATPRSCCSSSPASARSSSGWLPENVAIGPHLAAALNVPLTSVAHPAVRSAPSATSIRHCSGPASCSARSGWPAPSCRHWPSSARTRLDLGLGAGGMERVASYPGTLWTIVVGLAAVTHHLTVDSIETGVAVVKIEGSVVLVTGADRGLGQVFARSLVARGATRVYGAARQPAAVTEPGVTPIPIDITDPTNIQQAADALGDVTILVNNAGVTKASSFIGTPSTDNARLEMETNYFGTLNICRGFAPILGSHGGGAIVNMLSVASFATSPLTASYGASKAAAWSLTNGIRIELAHQGTHVVAVHASFIDTDMSAGLDVSKISPESVATQALDAVEHGLVEGPRRRAVPLRQSLALPRPRADLPADRGVLGRGALVSSRAVSPRLARHEKATSANTARAAAAAVVRPAVNGRFNTVSRPTARSHDGRSRPLELLVGGNGADHRPVRRPTSPAQRRPLGG